MLGAVFDEVAAVTQAGEQVGDFSDRVGMMAVLGFDHQRGAVAANRVGGALKHRQLVALDIDLDTSDVVQAQIVEPLHRNLDRLDRTAVFVCQWISAFDRAAAGIGLQHPHRDRPGLRRQRGRLDPDEAPAALNIVARSRAWAGRGSNAMTDFDALAMAIENSPTSAPISMETRSGSHSD